jgi:hypothetical protein
MKRSAQIGLVLMGATAVGTTSYALMPRDCPPNRPAAQQAAPVSGAAQPNSTQECRRRWSSSSSGSRSGWYWGSRSTYRSTSAATSTSVASSSYARSSGTTTVARGGFGSTGHAVSGGG